MPHAAPIPRSSHDADSPDTPLLPQGVMRTYLLVNVLFLLWGIPNNLNDVLIRQFMKSFELNRLEAGLVQFSFYLGYFLLALPAGILMRRKGYKAGFLTGLVLFACGCFLFLPAAEMGRYGFFLGALFVVASGLAFLETAGSPFVAQLGPSATAERRLNISAAFNPTGSILGVVVGNLFIFSGVELSASQTSAMQAAGTYAAYLHKETLRVVAPYLVLGVIALVWAGLIAATRFPAFITAREHKAEVAGNWRDLLGERHFLHSLLAQFAYVGAQVGTWSYLIQYAHDYAHTLDRTSGWLLTGTLVAFALGRILSSWLMRFFNPTRLMAVYAAANAILLVLALLRPGWIGLGAILVTSFFMSVMFPTIFGLGLKDLGPNTNIAGSMLVMTIIGGAVLTLLMGWLADHFHSTAAAYAVPLACYLVVLQFCFAMTRYNRRRLTVSTFEI
ncbi:L-fucose:H+ symporter permease [Silvibacterium sp.]|uniref:L-fucose:H+ symporter permease n=1 Tax=Silvibacterium sp. TaxID=1964179 RepID=UPI0039E71744